MYRIGWTEQSKAHFDPRQSRFTRMMHVIRERTADGKLTLLGFFALATPIPNRHEPTDKAGFARDPVGFQSTRVGFRSTTRDPGIEED